MKTMTKEREDKLYLYYQQKGILPTHARFNCRKDLDRYQASRSRFFTDKLHLPLQMFKEMRIVEFGSDTGENSLVFADWGARITVVEPNPLSWPHLLDYFKKFNLSSRLESLEKVSLERFKAREKFSFIDAEGFVYTIKPDSAWINVFDNLLADDGFFLISYYEAFGTLLELILKLIYSKAKNLTTMSSKDIAWELFQAKWNSIPHTRSFDSWFMDVMDNPFVRLKYFFKADTLCRRLAKAGFYLYSSWPNYTDLLNVCWHKKEISPAESISRNLDFIARSSLSFAFGKKLFISSKGHDAVERVNKLLMASIVLVDKSIARFDTASIRKCSNYLKVCSK